MLGASFDSTKTSLEDLLQDVEDGDLQLPDFQRGWVWDDDRIRSLLASVSVSFPIGAIMTLQTGGDVNFQTRPIEGAGSDGSGEPSILLLDGQQRLTSLYQALMTASPVATQDSRGKAIKRHYFVNMELALRDDVDRDEWIVSVPDDGVVRTLRDASLDLSTSDQEYKLGYFPANQMFDTFEWRDGYANYWANDPGKTKFWNRFERRIVRAFARYQLPVIALGRDTTKEAVCLVFEKVNTGGVTLTVFELLTASFAAEGYQLRDDWAERERRLESTFPVLGDLQSTEFLQVVTLLATQSGQSDSSVGCRRRDILALSVDEYKAFADRAEAGFEAAAKFLHGEHIFHSRDVPYRSQLVPLAAILAALGNDYESGKARDQIRQWYWNGVLGETYGGSTETIFARDLPEVTDWIRNNGPEPSTVTNALFQASRLRTLRRRNSAAYKGIHALLMREGCADFLTGQRMDQATYFEENVDIHHIFPQTWCRRQGITDRDFNSIINKTPLTARTNRRLGGRAPSVYRRTILEEAKSESHASEIVESHRIDDQILFADDFWGFYRDRAQQLIRLIEDTTGKQVVVDDIEFANRDATVDEFDDGPIDWASEAAS